LFWDFQPGSCEYGSATPYSMIPSGSPDFTHFGARTTCGFNMFLSPDGVTKSGPIMLLGGYQWTQPVTVQGHFYCQSGKAAGNDGSEGGSGPSFYCVKPPIDQCGTGSQGPINTSAGNPISCMSGEKSQTISLTDTIIKSISYSSLRPHGSFGSMGVWAHEFEKRLDIFTSTTIPGTAVTRPTISARRPNGASWSFAVSATETVADQRNGARLRSIAGGYELLTSDDFTETYDSKGRLITVKQRDGLTFTLAYNLDFKPITIADSFGRSTALTYTAGKLTQLTASDGAVHTFGYDTFDNITTIGFPGGTSQTLFYNEPANTSGASPTNALTGIRDENFLRYSTYKYSYTGKALSTELAGGVSKYETPSPAAGTWSDIYDPFGTRLATYSTIINGVAKPTYRSHFCSDCNAYLNTTLTYDANGNLASKLDFNGVSTTYGYDLTRDLETTRTEAAGTAQARTITTTWQPTYRLPATIIEPAPGGTKTTRAATLRKKVSSRLKTMARRQPKPAPGFGLTTPSGKCSPQKTRSTASRHMCTPPRRTPPYRLNSPRAICKR
jgi:YD repeat-containing protein